VFRKLLSGKTVSIAVAALPLLNTDDGSDVRSDIVLFGGPVGGGVEGGRPIRKVVIGSSHRQGWGEDSVGWVAKDIRRCVFPRRPRSTLARSQWINLKFSTSLSRNIIYKYMYTGCNFIRIK